MAQIEYCVRYHKPRCQHVQQLLFSITQFGKTFVDILFNPNASFRIRDLFKFHKMICKQSIILTQVNIESDFPERRIDDLSCNMDSRRILRCKKTSKRRHNHTIVIVEQCADMGIN